MELHTTFKSNYSAELLDPQLMAQYGKQATGEKFLVMPQK